MTNCGKRIQTLSSICSVSKDSSVGSVQGNNFNRSKPQGHIFSRAHRRVTCVFSGNGSETLAGTCARYGTRDAASNWEDDWQEHCKSLGYQLELSSKNLFRHEGHEDSGMTHGDDSVVTGPTLGLLELKNKIAGVYPIKTRFISHGSTESIKQNIALETARSVVTALTQTC